MRRLLNLVLCVFALYPCTIFAQSASANLEPVKAPAGTVLTFYLQTRMNPAVTSALDDLPKGTVLHVRLLDSIDSNVERDGAPFRGTLASPILSENNEVIVSEGSEVRGLFFLLRSKSHPEGFRYELMVTSVTKNGKSLDVTASLSNSFSDRSAPAPTANTASKPETLERPKAKNRTTE